MEDENLLEDLAIIRTTNFIRKTKEYKDRLQPFEAYNDTDFKKFYRFDKESAKYIIELLRSKLIKPNKRGLPLSPEDKVLIFLRYSANGLYQKDVAQVHNISQQSVTALLREVAAAIASNRPHFIKFPLSVPDIQHIKTKFWTKYSFPQCIGSIDCTQVKIKNPGGELGARHRCRKGFYSLNVQVICDADGMILDVVSRWRGSAHDSRIWRISRIKAKLEENQENLRGGVLLGDGGYPISKILLTPFRQNIALTPMQRRYQCAHIRARNIVEKVFGQLKNKFRICFNGLQVQLPTAKNIVVALCVLHNIAKINHVEFEAEAVENDLLIEDIIDESTSLQWRDHFISKYFSSQN